MSSLKKRWIIRGVDPGLTRSISLSARVTELVAALLVARGLQTPDAVQSFLNANVRDHFRRPHFLPGCDAVAQALYQAVRVGKRIAVFGDYDVDGITSVAILCKTLRDLGANDVRHYIPSRLDEGYGLSSDAISALHHDGCDVIVTVDCGINSLDEALQAEQLGIELLVTDHHIPGPELPHASAIAHPQLVRFPATGPLVSAASLSLEQQENAKKYPFSQLCGAGVALKIAMRLGDLAVQDSKPPLATERIRELISLATLATIADVVPLLDENRALVRSGLEILNRCSVSPGLDALLDVSKGKQSNAEVDAEFVAFQMAPRLNAAGRLGQAGMAAELLLSNNPRRCAELAGEIDDMNRRRKTMETAMRDEAEKLIHEKFDPGDPALVLDGLDWHRGILGIVASRIAEHYHRPTILLARSLDGKVVGSGRGLSGTDFNLYVALQSCEDLLIRFGGHGAAAGLTIDANNIDAFRKRFVETVARRLSEESQTATINLDGEFPLGVFTRQAVDQIALLAPFGCENLRPVFAARGVTPQNVRLMGKDGKHFEASFRQGDVVLRGIAFGRSMWVEEMRAVTGPVDIAFKVRISSFGSSAGNVELDILDWRVSEHGEHDA